MDTPKQRMPVLAELRFAERRREFDGLDLAERFELIYRTNLWGAETSQSGLGSELDATASLRHDLARLLRSLEMTSILDLPCGDFTWMAQMDLSGIHYLGADIVPDIVTANAARHGRAGQIDFSQLDLVNDPLPTADLILCRDCLVHLSFANVHRAIANAKRSGARWLLTTTFPDAPANRDIEDGDWRVLNFRHAPFLFPAPLALINEGCTEAGGDYADKSLALWRVSDLPGEVHAPKTLVQQLDGRCFVTTGNAHGLSTAATTFQYFVDGEMVTGSYHGGEIAAGQIIGKVTGSTTLELLFQCRTVDSQLLSGQSSGRVSRNHDGLLTIHFDWIWLTGDRSGGTSHYIEIASNARNDSI